MTREELESEVERLRAQNADLRMMIDGLETAAHEERAAVVAYLRTRPGYGPVADVIEEGEHRRKEDE